LALEAAYQLHGRFDDPNEAVRYAKVLLAFLEGNKDG
jgi:hypothetical protein